MRPTCVASMLLFIGLQSAQAQDPEDSFTIKELITGANAFFAGWQSAQMELDARKLQLDPATGEWVEHGVEYRFRAWDENRWHMLEKSAFEYLKTPGSFHARYIEALGSDNTVLQIEVEHRQPTSEEMAKGDLAWIRHDNQSAVVSKTASWFDGETGVRRFLDHRPNRQELLTGSLSPATDQILTLFDPRQCTTEPVMSFDRKCWKISKQDRDANGFASITICPSLDFAPVEFMWTRTGDDRLSGSQRVNESDDGNGHRMTSIHRQALMVSVEPDWSKFSIRSTQLFEYEGGIRTGFGKLEHYRNVIRPAADSAFSFQTPIENGTPVTLQNTRQLKGEWRDGKVVRVYDGNAVKELGTVKMSPPETSPWQIVAGLILGVGAIIACWGYQQKKQTNTGLKAKS